MQPFIKESQVTLESTFKGKLEKAILLSLNSYLSNKAQSDRFAQWAKMIDWDNIDEYFLHYENPTHRDFQDFMPFDIELYKVEFDRNNDLKNISGTILFDIENENDEVRYAVRSDFSMQLGKVKVLSLEDSETQFDIEFEDADTKLLDDFHNALEKEILLKALRA